MKTRCVSSIDIRFHLQLFDIVSRVFRYIWMVFHGLVHSYRTTVHSMHKNGQYMTECIHLRLSILSLRCRNMRLPMLDIFDLWAFYPHVPRLGPPPSQGQPSLMALGHRCRKPEPSKARPTFGPSRAGTLKNWPR